MKNRVSKLLSSRYSIVWSQSVLLGLMFLLFVSNAIGLVEFRSDFLTGVELNLEVFTSINRNMQLPQIVASREFLLLLISGLLLILLLPVLSPIAASVLVVLLAIPPVWIELANPFRVSPVPFQFSWLVLMILFGVNALVKYYTETREKKKLLETFSQFVPPEWAPATAWPIPLSVTR